MTGGFCTDLISAGQATERQTTNARCSRRRRTLTVRHCGATTRNVEQEQQTLRALERVPRNIVGSMPPPHIASCTPLAAVLASPPDSLQHHSGRRTLIFAAPTLPLHRSAAPMRPATPLPPPRRPLTAARLVGDSSETQSLRSASFQTPDHHRHMWSCDSGRRLVHPNRGLRPGHCCIRNDHFTYTTRPFAFPRHLLGPESHFRCPRRAPCPRYRTWQR